MGLEMAIARWQDPVRGAPAFLESTGATLMIGRIVPFRGTGEAMLERWDRWSSMIDDPAARAVPAHDLSRFEEYAGYDGRFRIAIGLEVATVLADEGPSAPIDRAAIDAIRARAPRALHDKILEHVASDLAPTDAWSLRTQRTRPLLVPFGPIASAYVALGRLTDDPEARAVRGRDMRTRRHARAVAGELVASACDWDVAEPDLDRVPPTDGAYHLIARYG